MHQLFLLVTCGHLWITIYWNSNTNYILFVNFFDGNFLNSRRMNTGFTLGHFFLYIGSRGCTRDYVNDQWHQGVNDASFRFPLQFFVSLKLIAEPDQDFYEKRIHNSNLLEPVWLLKFFNFQILKSGNFGYLTDLNLECNTNTLFIFALGPRCIHRLVS